jgi:tetratricopeptide (TPR) repeat protein
MRTVILTIVSSLALATAPARSQPADPGQAAYEEGRKLYDAHRWQAAIAKFQESYRLRHDAASLFDIAQAYRLTGDCVHAIAHYRQYKQEFPDATNLAKVDKFITELEPCAKEHEPKQQPPPTEPSKSPPPAPPSSPPPPVVQPLPPPTHPAPPAAPAPADTGHGKRLAGLAIAGGGAVLIANGFLFGHFAQAKADEVHSGSGVWNPSVEQAGQRDDLIARVLWGVGSAAIVGGVVLYVLGRGSDEAPHVAVVPSSSGVSLVWGCGF